MGGGIRIDEITICVYLQLARDVPTFVKACQMNECKVTAQPTSANTGNPSEECAAMFNGNSALKYVTRL
jgi:hypothetical protein